MHNSPSIRIQTPKLKMEITRLPIWKRKEIKDLPAYFPQNSWKRKFRGGKVDLPISQKVLKKENLEVLMY